MTWRSRTSSSSAGGSRTRRRPGGAAPSVAGAVHRRSLHPGRPPPIRAHPTGRDTALRRSRLHARPRPQLGPPRLPTHLCGTRAEPTHRPTGIRPRLRHRLVDLPTRAPGRRRSVQPGHEQPGRAGRRRRQRSVRPVGYRSRGRRRRWSRPAAGALLDRYPHLSGTVFDLPDVVAVAAERLSGYGDRAGTIGGSFFDTVPKGGDGYRLSSILHDWDDPSALAILIGVRKAMHPHAQVFVLDVILGEPDPAPT